MSKAYKWPLCFYSCQPRLTPHQSDVIYFTVENKGVTSSPGKHRPQLLHPRLETLSVFWWTHFRFLFQYPNQQAFLLPLQGPIAALALLKNSPWSYLSNWYLLSIHSGPTTVLGNWASLQWTDCQGQGWNQEEWSGSCCSCPEAGWGWLRLWQ